MKNLVIVESPAKAKTIEKFLGKDYKVLSSYGHIRDLEKKDFGVDLKGDFEPHYEISEDKKQLVKTLKAEAKKADIVWLASDEDREGEAIAWHLYEVLGLKPDKTRRIVFHEITKPAILHAIENPRNIDMDLVNAQQTRRVLDRIVGFELSPVLWRKIKPALSAGRVQSVAVRLICEREKEIAAFKPEPYFKSSAKFISNGKSFKAELNKRFDDENAANAFLEDCKTASFSVKDVSVKPLHRSPAPPFTTSTLQQEAARRLGFSVNRTMTLAQRLYEAGYITYMRTDSLNLSDLALATIATEIKEHYGDSFLKVRKYHTSSKGAQEAHEAIRPTYPSKREIDATADEQKLYTLIWKRAIASQMADANLEKTNVDIEISNRSEIFEASGEVVTYPGFMKVWAADDKFDSTILPAMASGDLLTVESITSTERFTQPQPRYTEASLVKKMEDLGIGRPSTYAPTISTIQTRDYVYRGESEGTPRSFELLKLEGGVIEKETITENTGSEKGKLLPTDVGMVVNDFLTSQFPDILDYNFTAKVEEKFDYIAEGKLPWKQEITEFYKDFHPNIEKVNEMRTEHKIGERILGVDPVSGKTVSVKIGRFGPVAQIGDSADEDKPKFAGLQKNQSMATITLEEALKLFELPRKVGEIDGVEVVAAEGRFGPYLRYGKLFVSIPKDNTPQAISIDEAEVLIKKKQEAEANKLIKAFDEMPGLQVLNGRYGPYLAYKPEGAKKAVNYKLPKGEDASAITFDKAKAIMEAQDAAPKKTKRSR